MYIKPYISDIVRLGLNIESVGSDTIHLRHTDNSFVTIFNESGFLAGVSIEYPSRTCVSKNTESHSEVIDFIVDKLRITKQ